jgi:capsule polysaccharide export protein KpsC/LpsZ
MKTFQTKKYTNITTTKKSIFRERHVVLAIDNTQADTTDNDVEATLTLADAKKLVEMLQQEIDEIEAGL